METEACSAPGHPQDIDAHMDQAVRAMTREIIFNPVSGTHMCAWCQGIWSTNEVRLKIRGKALSPDPSARQEDQNGPYALERAARAAG
jgi:hypothetical protein